MGCISLLGIYEPCWRVHDLCPINEVVNLGHVIEDLWDAVEVGPHPLARAVAVARALPSGHLRRAALESMSSRPELLVFRRMGLPAESTSYRSGYAEHTIGQQYGWFRPTLFLVGR